LEPPCLADAGGSFPEFNIPVAPGTKIKNTIPPIIKSGYFTMD
jgi:hypothetical protein